ncbi:hypothetical protein GCM10009760_49200 [Kitasatospora kazusensis]|uniref:Uncharacterized protein n=1 Tax=Kitasatospora kazusensis TaxID=407974 RepID=A0ABN3A2E5_9ACTN
MHRRGGQAGGLAQVRVAHPAVLKEQLDDALIEVLHNWPTYCPGHPVADQGWRAAPGAAAAEGARDGGMCRWNVAKDTPNASAHARPQGYDPATKGIAACGQVRRGPGPIRGGSHAYC